MRRRSLVWLMLVLGGSVALAPVASAGPPRPVWHVDLGTSLRSVAVASDGSIYAVGQKVDQISGKAVLVKFAPDGSRLWSRSWLPHTWAGTEGHAVDVAPSGRVVWAGRVQGQCEGSGWFLEVRRPGGGLVHRYVTPGWECDIAQRVVDVAASDDLIVVAGYDHGCCDDPFQDGWVRGFSATARPTWTTDIEPPASPTGWYDRVTGVSVGGLGNVYAAGWAATQPIPADGSPSTPGTPILAKLTRGGHALWTKRVPIRMASRGGIASVAARGDHLMLAADVRGVGVQWKLGRWAASDGWLGSFTTGGDLLWSRAWDTARPNAAAPSQVAVDRNGVTWVVGTRRDLTDDGLDAFIRRYAPGGALLGAVSIDGGVRTIGATGVAVTAGGDAAVTGMYGPYVPDWGKHGRLWFVAA